jgi:hypothetical protein
MEQKQVEETISVILKMLSGLSYYQALSIVDSVKGQMLANSYLKTDDVALFGSLVPDDKEPQ